MSEQSPYFFSEILKTMPTNKSIDNIHKKMTAKKQLENTIPMWGDVIVWSELHLRMNSIFLLNYMSLDEQSLIRFYNLL